MERGFRILVVSEISNFLELNSETKAQDSGIRITLFRTIGITWPTSKEISIIVFCSAVLEIKAGNKTDNVAASIACFGSVILGNASSILYSILC